MLLNRPEGVRVADGLGHASFYPAAGGGFPSTGVLDTFTDSDAVTLDNHDPDGAPGVGTWVEITGENAIEINSNQARINVTEDDYDFFNWNVSHGPRSEAFVTITNTGSHASAGPYAWAGVRLTTNVLATVDGYVSVALVFEEIFRIDRIDNGAGTTIDSVSHTFANGEQIGIRADSTAITGYLDGVEVLSAVDASYASAGVLGLWMGQENAPSTRMLCDDFGGGTMP